MGVDLPVKATIKAGSTADKVCLQSMHGRLQALLARRQCAACRAVCKDKYKYECTECTPGNRVRVWSAGEKYEGEVFGVEMALGAYDVGVTIWYDGEPKTVREGLGSYEWELM